MTEWDAYKDTLRMLAECSETYDDTLRRLAECSEMNERMRNQIGAALSLLGPEAPTCSGCEYEWNEAIRYLKEALK